jgi:hypothetical protein
MAKIEETTGRDYCIGVSREISWWVTAACDDGLLIAM